jgi:hypothetical protein
MKHTLKMLLTTTILVVPTAFGSAHLEAPADQPATSSHTNAVAEAEQALAAFNEMAASEETRDASDRKELSDTPIEGMTADPCVMPDDTAQEIARALHLAKLAHALRKEVRKAVVQIDAADKRKAEQEFEEKLRETLALILTPLAEPAESFALVLNRFVNTKLWAVQVSDKEHRDFVAAINSNRNFDCTQKDILKGLLPNAKKDEIESAINELIILMARHPIGFKRCVRASEGYRIAHGLVYELCEKLKNLEGITPVFLRCIAYFVTHYGDGQFNEPFKRIDFYNIAAKLYELSVSLGTTVRPSDTQLAIEKLKELGNKYPETSGERIKFHGMADALLQR